jgi:hypothetical protein
MLDEMADSDMRTTVGNASELEVSTTLTEGEDEDESSDGRQLGVVTRGGNTGIEFVYDLENDDPSSECSMIFIWGVDSEANVCCRSVI